MLISFGTAPTMRGTHIFREERNDRNSLTRANSKQNYLNASLVLGGMLPIDPIVPLPIDGKGVNVGGTLLAVRGPWAVRSTSCLFH